MFSSLGLEWLPTPVFMGFPGGLDSKESACTSRDLGSMPGSERSPGEGNGNPLQYSCLENSMNRGVRGLVGYGPWGHKESEMIERLTHIQTRHVITVLYHNI